MAPPGPHPTAKWYRFVGGGHVRTMHREALPSPPAGIRGAEESGLTGTVPMIRIEQIIDDLLSFDQQAFSTWKGHVRSSTEPRPSDPNPSRRASFRHPGRLATDSSKLWVTIRTGIIGPRLVHPRSEFDETCPVAPYRLVPEMCRTEIWCARIVPWCAWEGGWQALQVVDL